MMLVALMAMVLTVPPAPPHRYCMIVTPQPWSGPRWIGHPGVPKGPKHKAADDKPEPPVFDREPELLFVGCSHKVRL